MENNIQVSDRYLLFYGLVVLLFRKKILSLLTIYNKGVNPSNNLI